MLLTIQEVEHIAELAKLDLSAEEKEQYREQLSAILEYAAILQQVNTADILPVAAVNPQQPFLREDILHPSHLAESIRARTPHTADQHFIAPSELENNP